MLSKAKTLILPVRTRGRFFCASGAIAGSLKEIGAEKDKTQWADPKTRLKFLNKVHSALRLQSPSAWYGVTVSDIAALGGRTLLREYDYNLHGLLEEHYAPQRWDRWKMQVNHPGFWECKRVQRRFLKHVSKNLNIKQLSDWYRVSQGSIVQLGGAGLLRQHGYSLASVLKTHYPNHEWHGYRLERVPSKFWASTRHQKDFLSHLESKFSITKMEDWYKISVNNFNSIGGHGLLRGKYMSSLQGLLKRVYPDFEWVPWRFKSVPQGFWDSVDNRIAFIIDAEKELRIEKMEDWYDVKINELGPLGGRGLVTVQGSIEALLRGCYPDYNWDGTRFRRMKEKAKRGYWQRSENVKPFLKKVERRFNITDASGWYRVSAMDIGQLGQGAVHYWPQMILSLYPNHNWRFNQFARREKKTIQRLLVNAATRIFPQERFEEEYRLGMANDTSGAVLTLDVYFPDLELALEYQGEHHYEEVNAFGPTRLQQLRDTEKAIKCREHGITLVPVPYWWNPQDLESLSSTIAYHKPDLNMKITVQPLISKPPEALLPSTLHQSVRGPTSNAMDPRVSHAMPII